jgi:hypothetical protein
MKTFSFSFTALSVLAVVSAQGGINTRLGLLNNNPLGSNNNNARPQELNTQTSKPQASGRVPQGGNGFNGGSSSSGQQCCCVPSSQSCNQDQTGGGFGGPDLVGQGLIDPRINRTLLGGIGTRIVNTPSNRPSPQTSCPTNFRTCCFNNNVDVSAFQRTCVTPQQANQQQQGNWRQGCAERVSLGGVKQCGTRRFNALSSGLEFGQSSPGEFPFTCLLLNQNNDFVGTCVIVPEDFSNNNGRGTRKVLTAAHKLSKIGQSE